MQYNTTPCKTDIYSRRKQKGEYLYWIKTWWKTLEGSFHKCIHLSSSLNIFANIANVRGFQRPMRRCWKWEEKNFTKCIYFFTFAKVNMLIKYLIIFELILFLKWIHYLNIIKIILSNWIHLIHFNRSGIFFFFLHFKDKLKTIR